MLQALNYMPEETTPLKLSEFFYPYGFHRDMGPHPGIELEAKLRPFFEQVKGNGRLLIDLDGMKAFYGSFIDGAFGQFMDELKHDFFSKFIFVSETNPAFIKAVKRVFERHQAKQFNQNV